MQIITLIGLLDKVPQVYSAVIVLPGTTNSLLEDCAASGQGRTVLNILESDNIVVRRCWLSWSGPDTGGGDTPEYCLRYMNSSNVLMENNIGVNYTYYRHRLLEYLGT